MRVDFKSLEQKIALQVVILLEELFLLSLTAMNKMTDFTFMKTFQENGFIHYDYYLFSALLVRGLSVYKINTACKK